MKSVYTTGENVEWERGYEIVGRRQNEKGGPRVATSFCEAKTRSLGTLGDYFFAFAVAGTRNFRTHFPGGSAFYGDMSHNFLRKKCEKKYKKSGKFRGCDIDTFFMEMYINFHRRNSAALFFDRSGKEITD